MTIQMIFHDVTSNIGVPSNRQFLLSLFRLQIVFLELPIVGQRDSLRQSFRRAHKDVTRPIASQVDHDERYDVYGQAARRRACASCDTHSLTLASRKFGSFFHFSRRPFRVRMFAFDSGSSKLITFEFIKPFGSNYYLN